MEAIFSIGNLYFDIISIIILVLLICSIIGGATKGFLYSVVEFARVIVTYGAAIFLAKPFGNFLFNTSLGDMLVSNVSATIEGMGTLFSEPIPVDNQQVFVSEALANLNIPSFIADGLADKILEYIQIDGGQTLGLYISKGIVNYALIAIGFLIILIVAGVLFSLLKRFAKKVNEKPVLGGVNRLLGAALNLVVTYLVIDGLLFLLSFLTLSDSSTAQFLITTMYLNDESVMTLSKAMTQHSIIRLIFEALV